MTPDTRSLRSGLLVTVFGYLAGLVALASPGHADRAMTAALLLGAAVIGRALFKGGMRLRPACVAFLLALALFTGTTYLGTRLEAAFGPDVLDRLLPIVIPVLNGVLASFAIIWTRHKAENGGWPYVGLDIHEVEPR